jgi:hypothetical protein
LKEMLIFVLQLYRDRLYDDRSSSPFASVVKAFGVSIHPIFYLPNAGMSTRDGHQTRSKSD